jgi:hypothetical protein
VGADAAAATQDLTRLGKATSASQYESTMESTGLQQTLDDLDTDFAALVESVFSSQLIP